MRHSDDTELIDRIDEFYQTHYHSEIQSLAEQYPTESKSLYIDWQELSRFDSDLADDIRSKPGLLIEYAEEALRLYELSTDISLGHAHVRIQNLPETTALGNLGVDHRGSLIAVRGIIRNATDVQAKLTDAAFECQRCGTLTRIPQPGEQMKEPHECQGCERNGPFRLNYDQSELVDHQTLTLAGLTTSETADGPEQLRVEIEDDLANKLLHSKLVRVTGTLKLKQASTQGSASNRFEPYMVGISISELEAVPDEIEAAPYLSIPTDPEFDHTRLEEFLPTARTVINTGADLNEAGTKAKLITPLIHALGWSIYDNEEVRLEYSGDEDFDSRVDYVLQGPDHPHVVVEAKQLGRELEYHDTQLQRYMRLFHADWGVLTNGETYLVYTEDTDEQTELRIGKYELEELAESNMAAALSRAAVYGEFVPPTPDPSPTEVVSDLGEFETIETNDELLELVASIEQKYDEGAPVDVVIGHAQAHGMEPATAEHKISQLKNKGEVYEPRSDYLRTT